MPLGDDFKDIEEIFREAARKCKLQYIRGDLTDKPGSVIPQILHEIKRAAVVVADITGHNPNVFYEPTKVAPVLSHFVQQPRGFRMLPFIP